MNDRTTTAGRTFAQPRPLTDERLDAIREVGARGRLTPDVLSLLARLDAAERLLEALDDELGDVDLPALVKSLYKDWYVAKGETPP